MADKQTFDEVSVTPNTVVNFADIQLLLGLKPAQIKHLTQTGVLIQGKRGRWLLSACVQRLIQHRRKGSPDTSSPEGAIDYDVERARKMREEADKLKRQRLRDEKKILDREVQAAAISEALQVQKRELSALPLMLQRMVPGMSAKAIEQVTKACARSHNAVLDLQNSLEAEQILAQQESDEMEADSGP